ncbi:2505_t:CDS:1, partial [Entrophospora sp. SA101]
GLKQITRITQRNVWAFLILAIFYYTTIRLIIIRPYKQAATYIIDKEDYVPYSPDRHGITAWVIFLTSAF